MVVRASDFVSNALFMMTAGVYLALLNQIGGFGLNDYFRVSHQGAGNVSASAVHHR